MKIFILISLYISTHLTHLKAATHLIDKDLYYFSAGSTVNIPMYDSSKILNTGPISPTVSFHYLYKKNWLIGFEISKKTFLKKTSPKKKQDIFSFAQETYFKYRFFFPTYLNFGYKIGSIKPLKASSFQQSVEHQKEITIGLAIRLEVPLLNSTKINFSLSRWRGVNTANFNNLEIGCSLSYIMPIT